MDKRPCRLCQRMVKYRPSKLHPTGTHNRYTYKHRCTHGKWCRAGEPLTGSSHASACCPGTRNKV